MNSDAFVACLCTLAAGLLSAWGTRRFSHSSSSLFILDYPNERSLHTRPIPRTGGVAISTAVLLSGGLWVLYTNEQWPKSAALGVTAAFVAVTSFLDDRRHIAPHYRLLAHFAAAAALLFSGFAVDRSWLPAPLADVPTGVLQLVTVLYLVWMLELYNFMDGMDGFAGGMAVAGFGSLAVLSVTGGADLIAGLSLVIAAAAFGFLLLNFPPARIFMGDAGSATLGLLAGALSVWGAQSGAFPIWAAILVFSPFIVDATVTLVRRGWRREKIWTPHKTHYYQRLVQLGWSHRRVLLWEYMLMAATSASALWSVRQTEAAQLAMLMTWAVIYTLLGTTVHLLETTHHAHLRTSVDR